MDVTLDKLLETKLNEIDIPDYLPAQIMNYIQCSLMPELRRFILEQIKSTITHPPAGWVHQQISQRFPQIGFGSICRNLAILTKEGSILELDFGEGFKRFDGNTEPHSHFICYKCQCISDILQPGCQLVDLNKMQTMGYQVLALKVELRGVCESCQAM